MPWILNDPPPKFGAELAECQRYNLSGELYGPIIWRYNSNAGAYFIPTPTTMRAKPAIIGTVVTNRSGQLNGVEIPVNKIDVYLHPNGIYLFIKVGTDLNTDMDTSIIITGGLSCDF